MPKWLGVLVGGAEIATAAALMVTGAGASISQYLLTAGIGTLIGGIGTMLAGSESTKSHSTATRNPIAPWRIVYGQQAVPGTLIYTHSFGDNDKYLDMVFVLAASSCKDVFALMFDRQRIQIDTTAVPTGVPPSNFPAINGGTSFTPVQQTISIQGIARVNNVVTVQLGADIPLLVAGDWIIIQNVVADKTLNGKFQVAQILQQVYLPGTPGSVTFTFLSGGEVVNIVGQGQCKTAWPDYGRKIYMEVLTGGQTLGQTFKGMTVGTPNDGDTSNLITLGAANANNPWTAYCSCVGKTVVMLRLHYNDVYFVGGLPQISFLVHGKNDIADPRYSPTTYGYSENPALCIADFLANTTYGFHQAIGTSIPTAPLILAANICDQAIQLASPITTPAQYENQYTLNGAFTLDKTRGAILQDMLTACAGRITYSTGQWTIWPAAWYPGITTHAPGYTIQGIINVNAQKVVGDQTNFPMCINGTYPSLRTVANGGNVTSSSGYDITFSADLAGATLLNWEIEHWNPVTGEIQAWVNIPYLSSSNDKQCYCNAGNASITTFQGGAVGSVWDANYLTILHLANTPGLSVADSTANATAVTNHGLTTATGIVDGGTSGDWTSTYARIGTNPLNKTYGGVELWINVSAGANSGAYYACGDGAGPGIYVYELGIKALACTFGSVYLSPILTQPESWILVRLGWDSTGNVNLWVGEVYGTQVVTASSPYSDPGTISSSFTIGALGPGTPSDFWEGRLDELRLSNVPRSDGWMQTRFNNEAFPGSFYSLSFNAPMPINPVTPWGPYRWKANGGARDTFNSVKGTYINPGNNYQSSDFPPYQQDNAHGYNLSPLVTTYGGDVNRIFDGGQRRYLDIPLPYTNSASMAQRIGKIELLRRRVSGGNPVGTGTFFLPMAAYQQTALDIITMTLPFLSWTNKVLEIQALRLHIDETGMLGVEIDVQETASSNYDWALAEQLTPQGYQQTNPFGTQSPNIYTVGAFPGGGDLIQLQVNGPTLYDTITVNGV